MIPLPTTAPMLADIDALENMQSVSCPSLTLRCFLEFGVRARRCQRQDRLIGTALARRSGKLVGVEQFYPIGMAGVAWGDAEKQQWFEAQTIQRSYDEEVLQRLEGLDDPIETYTYGALPIDRERYPLLVARLRAARDGAPWALITGGVHGYETSGVQGAITFLTHHAAEYADRINLLVAPCVSPWGYEVINRWNPNAVDPNRSFVPGSRSEEAAALMGLVADTNVDFLMHIDLHETTDTDESEFRPALAARDGAEFIPGTIPDGFYTVGDTENPQPDFQAAIVAGVEPITHIALPDESGQLIGSDATQHGVINYPLTEWGLCPSITGATYTSTTEVYPDSTSATPEICIDAQVAAVRAALDFVLAETARHS